MNQHQAVHIGMINSYNVLVRNFDIQEIVLSGVGLFAHSKDEKDAKVSIVFMIEYFKELEIYDKCAGLQKYIENTFDEDGNFIEKLCQCEYPDIEEYSPIPKCSVCNMNIKRL